jgi:CubicO group peptidase (beta-lactamase class C family)
VTEDTTWLMEGMPPSGDAVVGVHNWSTYPHLRWGFLHTREVVPTARIERGDGPVLDLPDAHRDLDGVAFEWAGERMTVRDVIARGFTDGFLVLHEGRVVTEWYGPGMTPRTTHLLQSVSKSIAGTVAGVVIGNGALSPDTQVTDVLDELRGTSFEGATLRDVLDMRTGTAYDETYDHPDADVFLTEVLAGWRPHRTAPPVENVYEQIAALSNARPHGARFDYRSILTELLGWMLERAAGIRYPELVSRELWSQIGAEQDAEITIRHGVTLPDGGICVTLRDLARFALLHLREGRVGERQVVPREWIEDTRMGDDAAREAFARSPEDEASFPGGMYRNQWWVLQRGDEYTGLGIHGQFAYVNVPADVVCVKLSTWPTPLDDDFSDSTIAAFRAIAEALAG